MSAVEVYNTSPMIEQAEVLARSNLVPKQFRGKPADILVAMMLGHELGLGPMATMSYVDVIEGNATLNAEGKVSLVRKAGHSIKGESSDTRAVAHGKRRDTGDEMTVEWTLQMAQRAGLDKKNTWRQYPEAMLWSRAVSQLCRMLFPDVLAGLSYTPEEVESFDATPVAGATPLAPSEAERREGEPAGREPPAPPVPSAELQRIRMGFVERLERLDDIAKAHARVLWMKYDRMPVPSQVSTEVEIEVAECIIAEAEQMMHEGDESFAEHG